MRTGMSLAQADAAPRLDQVLLAHAAELGVVADEVGQLPALVHEVARGQALDLRLEIGGADQLAEDQPRIVEAEGLVEIRRQQEVLLRDRRRTQVTSPRVAIAAIATLPHNMARSRSRVKQLSPISTILSVCHVIYIRP